MSKINGQNITDGLRAFNTWRDEFLIEASTLFLMIGFVAGTVDVLTSDGLSQVAWFSVAWAIVQAIAIDGLFFAVWGKIRRATWTRATWASSLILVLVGLLLAAVAVLVNGFLSYQELNHVASISKAMASLNIDQAAFTYARAILVVLVSILVALFGRDVRAIEEQPIAIPATQITPIATPQLPATAPIAIPLQATTIAHSPEKATEEDGSGAIAHEEATKTLEQGATEANSPAMGIDQIIIVSSPMRDRIKQAMIASPDASYQAIANGVGCGYSTVKKYAQGIKKELSA